MGGKKKKFLARAITLGLLLAMPLGAQAEDYTVQIGIGDYAEYYWKNNSEGKPIKSMQENGPNIYTYTYSFDEDDRLIYQGGSNAAVNLANHHTKTTYDLNKLLYIEIEPDLDTYPVLTDYPVYGVYAKGDSDTTDGLTVKMGNGTIIARSTTSGSNGIYATKHSTMDLGSIKICSENNYSTNMSAYTVGWARGVSIRNEAIGTLEDKSIIRASTWGNRYDKAWAVSAEYFPTSVTLGSDTIINATCSAASGEATGIYVDGGTFEVGDNLTIIANGSGDGSVWVRGINSEVHPHREYIEYVNEYPAPEIEIGKNLKVIAINEATAAKHYTYDDVTEEDYVDNIDKPHTNSTSYAMYINYGKVIADENSVIYSAGSGDGDMTVRGIYINSVDNPLRDDPEHVDVEMIPAEVTLKANALVKATNSAQNGEVTGICARNIVNVEKNSRIIVTAEGNSHDSIGIYTESKKYDATLDKDFTTTAEVNLTDTDIAVINNSSDAMSYTAGIKAVAESNVIMQGGSIVGKSADGKEFKAIVTSDAGNVEVTDAVVAGSLIADDKGVIELKANDPASYLIGTVTTDDGVRNGGSTTDLTFKNTTWYMTGDSNVTNLNLDGGVISMVANEKEVSYTDYEVSIKKVEDYEIEYYYDVDEESYTQKSIGTVSGNAHKLSIDNYLKGSGTFIMDLKYYDNDVKSYENAADSDFIYIHGGDNSAQRLVFKDNNSNLGAMASDDKLYFAQIKNNAATFGEGGANVGEYSTVTAINEKGIYDLEFHIESEQNAEQADYNDWFITGKTKKSNPNGDGPIHSYNAGFALWRDDDTLLKRLGELRFTNDEGGAWARVIGKKLEDNRSMGFNTHAKTVQVGYDRRDVQEDGSGSWRKGVALGHTWADTSFRGGRGENNYTDLTLYATNIRKHDHYWDLVARIGYIDSEYDTAYGDRGEFDNWAGSLSAEYGRKKKLNEDNWFIEPQAQLTYSYMWGDSFTTRNGARVEQDNADSLVGRAGFIISKELESERKYPHRYYAKAFIMHEFLDGGDSIISFDSDRLYGGSDFKDTWYVVGVGANVDMGNSCTFYFDAERNFKAHVKMPYRVEAGFRWEF